jgi:hypothetical protein
MRRDRWHELNYSAAAYLLWVEVGRYKATPIVREVYIQATKLVRMLHNADLGLTEGELKGEGVSKSLRKRRGKLAIRVDRQYVRLLKAAEEAMQRAAEKDIGRRLTKAELKQHAAKFRVKISGVSKLMKEKYPIEDQ